MSKQEVPPPAPPAAAENQPSYADAVLYYDCPATHRFFNTKPFDYSIHNREVCSGGCESSPNPCDDDEPYFLSDNNGRLLYPLCCRNNCRQGLFPWSDFLIRRVTECSRLRQYCPNVSNIPHYFSKSNPRKRDQLRQQQCHTIDANYYIDLCNNNNNTNNTNKASRIHKDKAEDKGKHSKDNVCTCVDLLASKLETDPTLQDIDPDLTPLQRQLEIGLRKLRKFKPPVVWILGHPHESTTKQREKFTKSLATHLGFTYINMDTEIWDRTQTTSETLAEISNDYKARDPDRLDNVAKSAHARLVLMSWKITSNPSLVLNEDGVLEMLKLGLIHYHNAKGFVIDAFPCSETEGRGFEAMFYPATFAIYIKPKITNGSRLGRKQASKFEEISEEEIHRLGGILEPIYFRRSHSYHEKDIGMLALKYKQELKALILDFGMDLGEHEVELATGLVLEEIAKNKKQEAAFAKEHHPPKNYHDMAGGPDPSCYNPYCDCHVPEGETETKNPLLFRDQKAMDQIVKDMSGRQEPYHGSLLTLLDQRGAAANKEGHKSGGDDKQSLDRLYHGDWSPQSSSVTEGEEQHFRVQEVSSGMIGHGYHSDHHALRDTCSKHHNHPTRGAEAFEKKTKKGDENAEFLMKPKKDQKKKDDHGHVRGDDDAEFLEHVEDEDHHHHHNHHQHPHHDADDKASTASSGNSSSSEDEDADGTGSNTGSDSSGSGSNSGT